MIRNISKNTAMSMNAESCSSAFSKFIGLMFSAKEDKALVFEFGREKVISLHMVFVFYPIDVLFLDKNKVVVDMKENFRPFTFYNSRKKAMFVIELPDGAIKESRTGIGDKVSF